MKKTRIKGVLFDFDGTLTKPYAIDFPLIKKKLGCPDDMPILEFIDSLGNRKDKKKAYEILEKSEMEAARNTKLNDGAIKIMDFIKSVNLKRAIITRNMYASVERSFKNFKEIKISDFDFIITRDDPVRPKPHPEGIFLAADRMGIKPEELLVIGDYVFDIEAAQRAGAISVFLTNKSNAEISTEAEYDHKIDALGELKDIIRLYIPLADGKFPNDLLEKFLREINIDNDPSVIIHPAIGEDVAAVDIRPEEVVVLKSDPITFASDSIGEYAVIVNANDIATSGATPRWMLTTLLFPTGSTPAGIFNVLRELNSICRKFKITLCGGHTEITDAVTRPVVTGMLAGTVKKKDLVDKSSVKEGDAVLITKAIAVEGTSIIAREFESMLLEAGMPEDEISSCKNFLSMLDILKEAKIAAGADGISAMHDVTEGGLATALWELSMAGGHKIRVHMENIPVFPQTEKICRLLNIHPLGLIGSGSLLICCRKNSVKNIIAKIFKKGIRATYIGEVMEKGKGIEAVFQGKKVEWPVFETDEITKLFA